MRPPTPILALMALCGLAGAAAAETQMGEGERASTAAVFVRPLSGAYRHCGGACLKSGSLSWYCFASQECTLSCATAPPAMRCSSR